MKRGAAHHKNAYFHSANCDDVAAVPRAPHVILLSTFGKELIPPATNTYTVDKSAVETAQVANADVGRIDVEQTMMAGHRVGLFAGQVDVSVLDPANETGSSRGESMHL